MSSYSNTYWLLAKSLNFPSQHVNLFLSSSLCIQALLPLLRTQHFKLIYGSATSSYRCALQHVKEWNWHKLSLHSDISVDELQLQAFISKPMVHYLLKLHSWSHQANITNIIKHVTASSCCSRSCLSCWRRPRSAAIAFTCSSSSLSISQTNSCHLPHISSQQTDTTENNSCNIFVVTPSVTKLHISNKHFLVTYFNRHVKA